MFWGLNKIHLSGQDAFEYSKANEDSMWEGIIDKAVWTGLGGKSKESCAFMDRTQE